MLGKGKAEALGTGSSDYVSKNHAEDWSLEKERSMMDGTTTCSMHPFYLNLSLISRS